MSTVTSKPVALKLLCFEEFLLYVKIAQFWIVVLTVAVTGSARNIMVVERLEDGELHVAFTELTPEEHATQPKPLEPPAAGFDLRLSEEGKKDPILRMMAAECAMHGLARRSGHIWGE